MLGVQIQREVIEVHVQERTLPKTSLKARERDQSLGRQPVANRLYQLSTSQMNRPRCVQVFVCHIFGSIDPPIFD